MTGQDGAQESTLRDRPAGLKYYLVQRMAQRKGEGTGRRKEGRKEGGLHLRNLTTPTLEGREQVSTLEYPNPPKGSNLKDALHYDD